MQSDVCELLYIESSPRNDRLAYITTKELERYLDEIERSELGTREIGFTGGEPLLNPDNRRDDGRKPNPWI